MNHECNLPTIELKNTNQNALVDAVRAISKVPLHVTDNGAEIGVFVSAERYRRMREYALLSLDKASQAISEDIRKSGIAAGELEDFIASLADE